MRIERQQIKWFAYATVVVLSGVILKNAVYPPVGVTWVWWVGLILTAVGVVSSPVAMGVAIFRYRLYEIDILINRTLVYGSLTATLVALYFVGIVVMQNLFVVLMRVRHRVPIDLGLLSRATMGVTHRRD